MSDIKAQVQGYNSSAQARDIDRLVNRTGNIYESLAIISKRADQLNVQIRRELAEKLEEFAVVTDTIEEVQENKEQIEISKFYEKLPNPALIATEQFFGNKLHWAYRQDGSEEKESRSDFSSRTELNL